MTSADEGKKSLKPTELHSHGKAGRGGETFREKAEQLPKTVTPAAISQTGGMPWGIESTVCESAGPLPDNWVAQYSFSAHDPKRQKS